MVKTNLNVKGYTITDTVIKMVLIKKDNSIPAIKIKKSNFEFSLIDRSIRQHFGLVSNIAKLLFDTI